GFFAYRNAFRINPYTHEKQKWWYGASWAISHGARWPALLHRIFHDVCGVRTLVSNEESGFQDKSFIEASLTIMQFSNQWFSVLLSEKHRNTIPKCLSRRAADIPPLPFSPEIFLLAVPVSPQSSQAPLGSMPPSNALYRP
ncbi:hypothetical protein AVEN_67820-1, partial [Araneus ventricosus]